MGEPGADVDELAARLADGLLFEHALEVDARATIPPGHLRALGEAGLLGLSGPLAAGGLGLDGPRRRRVREALAGGCLTTAFVCGQHDGVIRRLAAFASAGGDSLLGDLCAGRRLAGQVLAGLLPGPPRLTIEPARGGYVLRGEAPAVSGWGYVDVLLVSARRADGDVAWALVDPAAPGLHARPRALAALNGSRTVALELHAVRIAPEAVVRSGAPEPWEAAGEGVRGNGAFALGVAGRCARIAGDGALAAAVDACRAALEQAPDGGALARARADAALLAARAAASLVVRRGARALDAGEHAQRLAREAVFLLAFGHRPAIRDALLEGLAAPLARG